MNSNAMIAGIEKVTNKWTKQRKREERAENARANRFWAMTRSHRITLKDAAWSVMKEAYMKASSNDTLPAHARQIMYAARGAILQATGQDSLDDAYFTQHLLPTYVAEHPEAQEWDVVYDARGHFKGPHTNEDEVSLGTLDVRRYLEEIKQHTVEPITANITGRKYPTRGPAHRFGAVLFIEKEGFLPLLDRVKLAERFDLAIMSTKGMSNIASRKLIDSLCGEYKIPLLVLHDFDTAGFTILGTLSNSTARYEYKNDIRVIDLGLRIEDVQACGLESETFSSKRRMDAVLEGYGASDEEIEFLSSKRVELNAFGSAEFVAWIEGKLKKHGIKKIIPDASVQAEAYRRALVSMYLEEAMEEVEQDADRRAEQIVVPKDLDKQVRMMLKKNHSLAWDTAAAEIARNANAEGDN